MRIVRLDAVGYVVKKAGTSCFMVEPEIWEVMDWLRDVAARRSGLTILPEVHDVYATHEKLSAHGYWTYDFVLPASCCMPSSPAMSRGWRRTWRVRPSGSSRPSTATTASPCGPTSTAS